MSSTNPTQTAPLDMPTLAPDVVLNRTASDVSKPEAEIKTVATEKDTAAGPAAPSVAVDTSLRAASTTTTKLHAARPSVVRRLMRGVIGLILTAIIAGGAVLWQSHGSDLRELAAAWTPPFALTLLSRLQNSAEPESASPAVQVAAVAAESTPSVTGSAADNAAATLRSLSGEQAQLLQSLARELGNLRQDMEQMKSAITDLKASDDQMAREIAKANDKATDRALEQALRPRVSMVTPPPAQPVGMPTRRPTSPPQVARPTLPRPAGASPQVATSYQPRPAEARAVAPRPQAPQATTSTPPMDLSAPRPPAGMREQTP